MIIGVENAAEPKAFFGAIGGARSAGRTRGHLDQAGFHPQGHLRELPARIRLLPLPPYSPELNPIEIIGDIIKDNILWSTLASLEEALGEELRPIYESAERVRRLVLHNWLINQVDATATENSAISN